MGSPFRRCLILLDTHLEAAEGAPNQGSMRHGQAILLEQPSMGPAAPTAGQLVARRYPRGSGEVNERMELQGPPTARPFRGVYLDTASAASRPGIDGPAGGAGGPVLLSD
jgi:hypothetical protein